MCTADDFLKINGWCVTEGLIVKMFQAVIRKMCGCRRVVDLSIIVITDNLGSFQIPGKKCDNKKIVRDY